MGLPRDTIAEFIDCVVERPAEAEAMFQRFPDLLDARWIHQESILHFLAVEGFHSAVSRLAQLGWDLNTTNEFGDTALIDVALIGDTKMAELLLRTGADPNFRSPTYGTALECAIEADNGPMIDLLRSSGAS